MLHPAKRKIYFYFWTYYVALAKEHSVFATRMQRDLKSWTVLVQKKRGKIALFGYFRKTVKNDYQFCHGTNPLPLDRFSWNLIIVFFEKSRENSSLIKILQKYSLVYMKTCVMYDIISPKYSQIEKVLDISGKKN